MEEPRKIPLCFEGNLWYNIGLKEQNRKLVMAFKDELKKLSVHGVGARFFKIRVANLANEVR